MTADNWPAVWTACFAPWPVRGALHHTCKKLQVVCCQLCQPSAWDNQKERTAEPKLCNKWLCDVKCSACFSHAVGLAYHNICLLAS